MPLLNPPDQGGPVTANTFNITRVTSAVAALLGVVTAASGGTAKDAGGQQIDWMGFDQGQRLVIMIALIAAVVVIHAIDVLARSHTAAQANGSPVVPLPAPVRATMTNNAHNENDHKGHAVALRQDGQVLFRNEADGNLTWAPSEQVTLAQ